MAWAAWQKDDRHVVPGLLLRSQRTGTKEPKKEQAYRDRAVRSEYCT